MKEERYATGILNTNCYLAINEETKETVVVDPADCPKYLMRHIKENELKIVAILLTHGHFDHTMGIDKFLDEYKVPVYVHEEDAAMLEDIELNLSRVYTSGYTFSGAWTVRDKQILHLAGEDFEVIHTPGHTRGGCCYYVAADNVLFSGDTLFQNSVGRTDFETSSMSDLVHSIRDRLFVLPDETHVYPGHMGETMIGHEKKYNPFI